MNARTYGFLLTLSIAALLPGCAESLSVGAVEPNANNVALAHKRILVTFADASIGRVPISQPGDYYRQRSAYQSSTWSSRVSAELAQDYGLVEVNAWPIAELGVHCIVFAIAANRSVDEVMEGLSHDERVESVQRMHLFRVLSDPYYRLQKGLHLMQISEAHRWATGHNVTIAVVDTGVDVDHPDLEGQIADSEDLVADDPSAFLDDIHGTAVAGVIAAIADNGQGIVGIAPDSTLIALKACWSQRRNMPAAVCDSLTLAKALDRAIALKPDIVNLSLTGPRDALLTRLLQKAMEQGIIVVAADAGAAYHLPHDFPASTPGVISVRASDSESVPADAETNPLFAPGADVLTTFPHGAYDFVTGSSFAAANVTGVVALLLELNPDLSAAEVKKILRSVESSSHSKSVAIVNACAAIAKIRSAATCDAPVAEQVNPSPSVLHVDLKPAVVSRM